MPVKQPSPSSKAAETFALHLRADKLPLARREYVFHPTRQWRFDFAWPGRKLAVEIDGLTRDGGRHQRVRGYENDCEKLNEALLLGWRVLRFTQGQVKRGEAIAVAKKALAAFQPQL